MSNSQPKCLIELDWQPSSHSTNVTKRQTVSTIALNPINPRNRIFEIQFNEKFGKERILKQLEVEYFEERSKLTQNVKIVKSIPRVSIEIEILRKITFWIFLRK